MSSLQELQRKVHETAVEKGWWQESRDFGMVIALMHSELSEALEAWRDNKPAWYRDKDRKPEGWGIELADCVIRILDMCEANELDMSELLHIKIEYNKTRPYRHGGKRA